MEQNFNSHHNQLQILNSYGDVLNNTKVSNKETEKQIVTVFKKQQKQRLGDKNAEDDNETDHLNQKHQHHLYETSCSNQFDPARRRKTFPMIVIKQEENVYDTAEGCAGDDGDEGEDYEEDALNLTQMKRVKGELFCVVCEAAANGYNFDAITCESCKAFFRRNAFRPLNLFRCSNNNACVINTVTRKKCKKCRILKCFSSGMRKDWIMTEGEREEKRKKIEENRRRKSSASVSVGGGGGDYSCFNYNNDENEENERLYNNEDHNNNSCQENKLNNCSITPPYSFSIQLSQDDKLGNNDANKPIRRRRRRRRHSLVIENAGGETINKKCLSQKSLEELNNLSKKKQMDELFSLSSFQARPLNSQTVSENYNHPHRFEHHQMNDSGDSSVMDVSIVTAAAAAAATMINHHHPHNNSNTNSGSIGSTQEQQAGIMASIVAAAVNNTQQSSLNQPYVCICKQQQQPPLTPESIHNNGNIINSNSTVNVNKQVEMSHQPSCPSNLTHLTTTNIANGDSSSSFLPMVSSKYYTEYLMLLASHGAVAKEQEEDADQRIARKTMEDLKTNYHHPASKFMTELEVNQIKSIKEAYRQAIRLVKAHGTPNHPEDINTTINVTELAVRRIIFFFKLISDFRNLDHDLMVKLLKHNMMSLLQIHGVNSYNLDTNTFQEPNTDDTPFSASSLETVYGPEIYGIVISITRNLYNYCHQDKTHIKILMLIMLFDPSNVQLEEAEKIQVSELLNKYMSLLYVFMRERMGVENAAYVFKAMLFECNRINDLAVWFEKAVHEQSNYDYIRPLMKEIFSFPNETPPASTSSSMSSSVQIAAGSVNTNIGSVFPVAASTPCTSSTTTPTY